MRNTAQALLEPREESRKLSEQILSIEWERYYPMELAPNETVRQVGYDVVAQFMKENFETIYGKLDSSHFPFAMEKMTPAKEAFLRVSSDCFAFYRGEKVYGIFLGNPIDWSSYYVRHLALLPEEQQGNRMQAMFGRFMEILAECGIHRVECDIAPSNLVNIHILNKMRFNIVGVQLSERWGALLRMVRFVSAPHEQVFLQNFCHGVRYQQQPRAEKSSTGSNVVRLVRSR